MATKVNSQVVYQRPESLTDTPTHYCPGCTHGVAHRLVAEVLDEMNLREKTIRRRAGGMLGFRLQLF
jgi:2-oxoglutarate/2-oxoacid ferredoxin oxidoreductase subunit beta